MSNVFPFILLSVFRGLNNLSADLSYGYRLCNVGAADFMLDISNKMIAATSCCFNLLSTTPTIRSVARVLGSCSCKWSYDHLVALQDVYTPRTIRARTWNQTTRRSRPIKVAYMDSLFQKVSSGGREVHAR